MKPNNPFIPVRSTNRNPIHDRTTTWQREVV